MRLNLPNYTENELWEVLQQEPVLPAFINEDEFDQDIKNNQMLKWKINSSLFKAKIIGRLLSEDVFSRWTTIRALHWFIAAFTALGFSLWSQDPKFLIALLILPFLMTLGILDMSLFLVLVCLAFIARSYLHMSEQYFWFYFLFVSASYFISWLNYYMAGQSLIRQVLSDLPTFWKYYSNKMIDIDLYKWNPELRRILNKYPGLNS